MNFDLFKNSSTPINASSPRFTLTAAMRKAVNKSMEQLPNRQRVDGSIDRLIAYHRHHIAKEYP